jgi:hypothetical protein
MLRTELVDLINSRRAWAFVGSGASADCGIPTWPGLIQNCIATGTTNDQEKIRGDSVFKRAWEKGEYPKCFSRIENFLGRPELESSIKREMKKGTAPNDLLRVIADLPFAGYVTTNYDALLETALKGPGSAWLPIGNSLDEIRKLSGGPSEVIWHLHGATNLPDEKSRLIITEKDYDDLYLEETPIISQLRSLLAQNRFIFIGFGLKDAEVMRILKRVGRLSNPARPIFAFMPAVAGGQGIGEREELLTHYNVDILPYSVIDKSHKQLQDLLSVYSALTLRRSLTLGGVVRPTPSHDPETTGLLLYNELNLRAADPAPEQIVNALLRARVLSRLRYQGAQTEADLVRDLDDRARLIQGRRRPEDEMTKDIQSVLSSLKDEGLIRELDHSRVGLSASGDELVATQAGTAERMAEQFAISLEGRAAEFVAGDEAQRRVSEAAIAFFADCIERRALGVAMAMFAARPDQQSFHIVGLLQNIPEFMAQLTAPEEAIALSQLILKIFARPSQIEGTYIGLALQAQFGVHMLGYDPATLRTRAESVAETLFLLDSTTMIGFLARSSTGFTTARLLVQRLLALGASIASTDMLIEEVAEHVRYALASGPKNHHALNYRLLVSATGRAGQWLNAFVEGFLDEVSTGGTMSFEEYLDSIFGAKRGERFTKQDVTLLLTDEGIECHKFGAWEGFDQALFYDRDLVQEQIAERREKRGTYKHDRQVKAEAEALIVIRGIRSGTLSCAKHKVAGAFFVSHSRVIDEVAGGGVPITMRPEGALQWLATLKPCTVDELSGLTQSLLWELSERGFAIVDKGRLQAAFSPYASASKEQLNAEIQRHHALIARRYGEPSIDAFQAISELDAPIVLENYFAQKSRELEAELAKEKTERLAAQKQGRINQEDRDELERLRSRQKQKRTKAKRRQSASKSQKEKRPRKRK